MNKQKHRLISVIAATASVIVFGATLAMSQGFPGGGPGGGGGFPGGGPGGGPGGRGPGGGMEQERQNICDKDKDLCALMADIKSFCADNGKYCEISGLPAEKNKKGKKDSGEQPDMGPYKNMGGDGKEKRTGGPSGGGPGGGMAACMNGGKECSDFKAGMKDRLAFAKKAKEFCEKKDAEVCDLMTQTDAFCMQNRDICYPEIKAFEAKWAADNPPTEGGQQQKMPQIQIIKSIKPYKELLDACASDTGKCDESKIAARERLLLLNDTKGVCAKDSKFVNDCDPMVQATKTCANDLSKCKALRETKALCRENPDACEKMKEQSNESAIDGLKTRCKKNPDACKQNIAQKRSFCNQNPNDCDKDTLHMLDAMEAFIAQM